MKHLIGFGAALAVLAACTTAETTSGTSVKYASAVDAMNSYYRQVPVSALPKGPALLPVDTSRALTRVIFASCNDEEKPDPTLAQIATEKADLFLFIGDNVYGDRDGNEYASFDVELNELRESYSDLAKQPEYLAVTKALPILATWDDHDMGMNDFGRDFAGKILSERIFENFFHLEDEAGGHDGVYYSKMFGPEGQRTQIIMLDTRFFRSDLTKTDEYGKLGRERYVPSRDPDQTMLGDAQWKWLQEELKKPADLRLLVSSIQVVPTEHGWEAWSTMPLERDKLYKTIDAAGADRVVILSGDRHQSFLYKDADRGSYPVYEITSSSLNVAFAREPVSTEKDARMIGEGYAFTNYGEVAIDWDNQSVKLALHDESGAEVRSVSFPMSEIQR